MNNHNNIFAELTRRGMLAQMSHPEEIEKLLQTKGTRFYIGFDATADSLHVGHLVQLILMSHLQKAGHKPYALLGTGTTLVGDPSGKTDMRQMLTSETIAHNAERFREQMSRFLDFSDDCPNKAEFVKNGDWLLELKYLEFIRDIGVHFTVNRMLAAECFKKRMEQGLSFFEFNYMLIQAYDFLHLFKTKDVILQVGGDDQWSNILAGADLIRRTCSQDSQNSQKEQKSAFAMTTSLLLTKDGAKMGKTIKGALWLSPEKCSPYDFYQYFRNVDDADVVNCLKMLTFVPVDEIEEMEKTLEGADAKRINQAKELLAFEATKLVHGEPQAEKARDAAKSFFKNGGNAGGDDSSVPTVTVESDKINILDLLVQSGLCGSKRDARTNTEQGGVSVDDVKITDVNAIIEINESVIVKKGKKNFIKIVRA